MLRERLPRRPSSETALSRRLVFAGVGTHTTRGTNVVLLLGKAGQTLHKNN